MAKRLSGSAQTGKKIIENWELFKFYKVSSSIENGITTYNFDVVFGNNKGTFVIRVKSDGSIDESSTLNMDNFKKSLGMYNDPSLIPVIKRLINNF